MHKTEDLSARAAARCNRAFTYSVEPVVDQMLQIFAHPDLSHQLVLVAVHACQLTHMSKDVLQPISQLQHRKKKYSGISQVFINTCKFKQHIKFKFTVK